MNALEHGTEELVRVGLVFRLLQSLNFLGQQSDSVVFLIARGCLRLVLLLAVACNHDLSAGLFGQLRLYGLLGFKLTLQSLLDFKQLFNLSFFLLLECLVPSNHLVNLLLLTFLALF